MEDSNDITDMVAEKNSVIGNERARYPLKSDFQVTANMDSIYIAIIIFVVVAIVYVPAITKLLTPYKCYVRRCVPSVS